MVCNPDVTKCDILRRTERIIRYYIDDRSDDNFPICVNSLDQRLQPAFRDFDMSVEEDKHLQVAEYHMLTQLELETRHLCHCHRRSCQPGSYQTGALFQWD